VPAPAPAPSDPAPAPAPAEPPAPDDAALNLLAALPSEDPAPAEPPPPAPAAAEPESVKAIAESITPVDLGTDQDGTPVPWDSAAVEAVSAVFARRGISKEVANEIVQAYAAHFRARHAEDLASRQASEAGLNRAMVAACRDAFGPDLPRYLRQADRGGLDIFGPELWPQLRGVQSFSNDHRIISALAARGRAVTDDPAPGGAGASTQEADLAKRMYG